ncbi:murein hydrolase activator EnvC family protein [Marinomonas mediterranea]|uniref:murein hydrolase activator EnvC family protein n=1 Tax=Marinomonas mediterranea TaxID=119864 RepID=UPI00234AF168|nr:peptidoglycan DD-metalloendopeptidase family protein [Marinomonas mediterranea]WCN10681.1 peptidoglycan DD-metalloendopeptidase family protein [Marinomonas mediterranea]
MLFRVFFGLCLLCLSSLGVAAAQPQTPEEARQQIDSLQKDLKKLNGWLKEIKSERSDVEKQLESKEQSIQLLHKKIQELQLSLKKGEQQLSELSKQQRNLQLSIQQQNDQIAAQLRAVYRSGEQDGLKLLLSDNQSADAMRLVHYNRYFSQARQSVINGYVNEVRELSLVEKSIRSHRAQQIQEQTNLQKQRNALKAERLQRKTLLAKLNQDLKTGNQKQAQLSKNQKQLSALLERLEEALVDIQIPDQDVSFASQKGKLVKPIARLTKVPDNGQINLGGITLKAKEGDNVRAIFHGRVVFADWMRGFGFLIILDHGDGYMSLYGYNQSILKDVGEWVAANEVIATVGSSGGRLDPGLFFAIRHNSVPLSPLKWVGRG